MSEIARFAGWVAFVFVIRILESWDVDAKREEDLPQRPAYGRQAQRAQSAGRNLFAEFGGDEGDVVLLFAGVEPVNLADEQINQGLGRFSVVALQRFDQARQAEFFS